MHEKASAVLAGGATRVAAAIRRKATYHGLDKSQRANADTYLTAKAPYLGLPRSPLTGLANRHRHHRGRLPAPGQGPDGITGARWGVEGAEAVLKLRALRVNGDFDDYWAFPLSRERARFHEARYLDNVIPLAA